MPPAHESDLHCSRGQCFSATELRNMGLRVSGSKKPTAANIYGLAGPMLGVFVYLDP